MSHSALILTLAFAQIFHAFRMRNASVGFLDNDVTRNPYVRLALLLCAALLVGSAYLPVVSTVLELKPPAAGGWGLILAPALLPLLAGEVARRLAPGGRTSNDDAREP